MLRWPDKHRIMSFFQIIREERYSRALLDQLEELLEEQEDERLLLPQAEDLLEVIQEGGVLTRTDLNTLRYISEYFPLDEDSSLLIREKLEALKPGSVDRRVDKVVKFDFGISHLSLNITPSELSDLDEQNGSGLHLEEAFAEILYAWFTDGLHPLSPYAVLMNYYRLYPGQVQGWDESLYGYLKAHFNEATIDLLKAEDWLHHKVDNTHYWGLRLTLHQFPNYRFYGFVARSGHENAFCRGIERSSQSAS